MSRPDWGALQQEYIAEYTRSGISPVAWCEALPLLICAENSLYCLK